MAAAGKFKLYNTAKLKIGQSIIDLDGHTFKMALFLSTSNCNTLTYDEYADLTNEVANGNGYTTGGVTMTAVTLTNSSGTITFDSDNVEWNVTGAGITARFAVIYDDSVAGDPLLAVFLLDATPADVTGIAGDIIQVSINASGIFTMSGATTD